MDFVEIGKKWQKFWKENQTYKVVEKKDKKSFYILDMFPYPSGAGLHVWHPKWYIATDVIARKHMLQWEMVLHPMGFDTFGLGTEQFAIANKIKPQIAAEQNIATYKKQLEMFGCTYDWDREVNTADPNYFKWTQKVFLDLYNSYFDEKTQSAKPITDLESKIENGQLNIPVWMTKEQFLDTQRLAYIDYKPINRCPSCKTWLANEDLNSDWTCERCSSKVEQKPMRQRVVRITKYAERLLDWLESLPEWTDSAKEQQRNWIWKSEWTQFKMEVIITPSQVKKNEGEVDYIEVYTTRIDTVFGMSFVVMAPEHKLVESLKLKVESGDVQIKNWDKVQEYIEQAKHKTQLERTELQKEKTWVILDGVYAINPFNWEEIPVYIGDYVLANYWTGVVMAVPAHDERDFEFAKKYDIKITQSIAPLNKNHPDYEFITKSEVCYTEKGILVNSGQFSGLTSDDAITKMQERLEEKQIWWKKINYRLQDRVFSRQRYRWEPFPIVFCNHCDSKLTINFRNKDTRNGILSGNKTIETRALNPEEPERFFGNIKAWDIVVAINKETNEELRLKIIKTYQRKDLRDMRENEDHETIKKIYRNKEMFENTKTFDDFESKRALTEWYIEKIKKNGLVWREFELIGPAIVTMKESDLPLLLPDVENYEPTGTEEGPLANIEERINVECPKCWWKAKRESNTMPGWAGSSRYWIRYMDPHNDKELVSSEKEKFWHPVDIYVWGAEHITRHMIYARFWHKFLQDLWIVSVDEPFKKYQHVWLIMAEDGRKMSKRRWNVINPDDIINEFGADVLRMYEMFMWPFDQAVNRNTNGVKWIKKFLDKVISLRSKVGSWNLDDKNIINLLHKTIKKVSEDIDVFGFNTAISQLMIFVNELNTKEYISEDTFEKLTILLAPFAPHLAEELWSELWNQSSIFHQGVWPKYDEKYLVDDVLTIAVQVNWKVRWTIEISPDSTQEEVFAMAKENEKITKYLDWEILKIIYIPWKICNIVVK
jgi:leucyl-tRNA synthetase